MFNCRAVVAFAVLLAVVVGEGFAQSTNTCWSCAALAEIRSNLELAAVGIDVQQSNIANSYFVLVGSASPPVDMEGYGIWHQLNDIRDACWWVAWAAWMFVGWSCWHELMLGSRLNLINEKVG